ncbi:hypothetical protein PENTCL1PPCAC_16904, partial [Pristionchus entomophagus]
MATPSHPWECHLNVRGRFKTSVVMDPPDCHPPPLKFDKKAFIAPPEPGKAKTRRECVTLADVVSFRTRHVLGAKRRPAPAPVASSSDDDFEIVDAVAESLGGLTLERKAPTERPVLYRDTGVTKDKGQWTILEAQHFEVFLPDRKDLRFIAVPSKSLTATQSVEGHLFAVFELHQLERSLPKVMLQAQHPILWEASRFERLESAAGNPFTDLIYVVKVMDSGDARAVCNWSPSLITVHAKRFHADCQNEDQQLEENALYEASMVDTSSAWIYPVEPPKNRVDYAKLVAGIRSSSMNVGMFAEEIQPLPEVTMLMVAKRLRLEFIPESMLLNLFQLGIRFREINRPKELVNVIVKSIDPPELIVLSEVYFVDYVSLFIGKKEIAGEKSEEKQSKLFLQVNSISHPRRGNNKHSILRCAPNPRMLEEFRGFNPKRTVSTLPKCEAHLESKNNNITLQSLELIETRLLELQNPIGRRPIATEMTEAPPPIYEYLYGRMDKPIAPTFQRVMVRRDDRPFVPNERQGEALSMYHDMNSPAFCILSPPGSGKTTVAAAMAASLVDNRAAFKPGEVQLLLAVQNVAVENLARSLKTFDENRLRAYYIKSLLRTDAESKAPYNIKELIPNYTSYMENAEDSDLIVMQRYLEVDAILKAAKTDPAHKLSYRQRHKLTFEWHKMLRKAKATLEKYLQPQILLSTVDLALCYLQSKNERGIRKLLTTVTRVIIDEASLLTESTFYCLMRLFPRATFVLIGDDKQLPPFMFDEKVIGHQLAARSALSVALVNQNLPVIKLVEVYRAPPRLVDPYNKLSYDGDLVSRNPTEKYPLTEAGLVALGDPQLLLVGIEGGQKSSENSKSMWNREEIEALLSLLQKLAQFKDQIMIICLYKEQKKRLEIDLGINYELHTVDSAQGKEKPIIIVLTTRTDKRTPFFASKERCTVAVSRQQQALIIIGNPSLLKCEEPEPWAWSICLSSARFTSINDSDLPPVDPDIKAKLANMSVEDGDDVTDVPVNPSGKATYAVTAEQLEEQAAEKQNRKKRKKK